MGLKPGMRVLEIGCGWGGPLTYLCKTFGVTGVGVTVSQKQRDEAEARAKRYGVDAQFVLTHWEHFEPGEQFDAVFSDEVIVHFHDLEGFFKKCWTWLKPGGRMVHKELHFTHAAHTIFGRTGANVNKIFGFTGNYRLLAEELMMVNNAGFELTHVHQIDMTDYRQTMDYWLANLFENREAIKALVGEQVYTDFRKYIKICRWAFGTTACSLDVIASTKIDADAILAAKGAE
jgi:cyclopropane-fatty-acyl-phospholipid synthase